jgi:hypothetical protein
MSDLLSSQLSGRKLLALMQPTLEEGGAVERGRPRDKRARWRDLHS